MQGVASIEFGRKLRHIAVVAVCMIAALMGLNGAVHAKEPSMDIEQDIRSSMAVGNLIKAMIESSAGFPITVISADRKSNSPFQAIVSEAGSCILVVNKKIESWSAWSAFTKAGRLDKTDSFYFAMLHEVGHCINKLSHDSSASTLPEGIDSELYADVFALVTGSRLLSMESYQQLSQGVIRARLAQERWFRPGSHSTGVKLQKAVSLIRARADAQLNLAEAVQHSRLVFSEISSPAFSEVASTSASVPGVN